MFNLPNILCAFTLCLSGCVYAPAPSDDGECSDCQVTTSTSGTPDLDLGLPDSVNAVSSCADKCEKGGVACMESCKADDPVCALTCDQEAKACLGECEPPPPPTCMEICEASSVECHSGCDPNDKTDCQSNCDMTGKACVLKCEEDGKISHCDESPILSA